MALGFARFGYAFSKRTGYVGLQMPAYRWQDRPLVTWLKKDIPSTPQTYAEWRKQNCPKFFFADGLSQGEWSRRVQIPENALWDPRITINEAEKILSGNLKYFSHAYYQTGFPPNWHADPVTGIKLDSQKHWSRISDDPGVDIKTVWEPSRFAMVYPLFRAYASTQDERYAEAFWRLIQAWAESNPPNTGPNWMDGPVCNGCHPSGWRDAGAAGLKGLRVGAAFCRFFRSWLAIAQAARG